MAAVPGVRWENAFFEIQSGWKSFGKLLEANFYHQLIEERPL